MLSALKYMHAHKVIHRDLKLGNLFLNDKMEIKIGDFGLATKLEFDGDRKRTICGTPNYIAPEILEGKTGHSYEVDIWSMGVIFYTMLIGKPPFETSDVKTTYQRIKKNVYSYPDSVPLSNQAKDMINQILQTDPAARLTIDQIMEHDFFKIPRSIPKNLPPSTLACPPSEQYLQQFMDFNYKSSKAYDKNKENKRANSSGRSKQSKWEVEEEPYVHKYVDLSSKYGIGYSLTNGCTGAAFNDNTFLVLRPDQIQFNYFEKNQQHNIKSYTVQEFPTELDKKVKLLKNFKQALDTTISAEESSLQKSQRLKEFVFVKKWLKTKHALVLKLSNKVIQVNYQDGSELLMSTKNKKVSYLNSKGERVTYLIAQALQSQNEELIKRLNYAR